MDNIRRILLALVAMLVVQQSAVAQPGRSSGAGSLCVLPHVKKAEALRQSPILPPAADTYSLRLDDGKWVALSANAAVLLAGIPLSGRHNVAIRGDGKPFSAFTFTFDELHTASVCVSQSPLYLVWRYHPSAAFYAPCQCGGVAPADWKPR
jgi:hypothetical protein